MFGAVLAVAGSLLSEPLHTQLFSSFFSIQSSVNPQSNLLSDSTFEYIDGLVKRWDLQDVSLSVVRGPDADSPDRAWTREAYGFGVRDRYDNPMQNDLKSFACLETYKGMAPHCIKAWDAFVDNETILAIGSNSKLFTSISVGLLISNDSATYTSLVGPDKGREKRLICETKVADVIPEFQLMDQDANRLVNVADLLTHRSGMTRHDQSYNHLQTASEIVRNWRYLEPSAQVREYWQYNNTAYVAASLLPRIMTGIDFPTYVNENILLPLGMKDTHILQSHATATGRRADGFVKPDLNWTKCGEGFEKTGTLIPSKDCLGDVFSIGGVSATAEDLSIWVQALLTHGVSPLTGEQVIPASIIDDVVRARSSVSDESAWPEQGIKTYGLAQFLYSYRGHNIIEHLGDVPGQKSNVIRLPDSNIGISIVVNDDDFGTMAADTVIKWRVLDDLLGLKPIDWEARAYNRTLHARMDEDRATRAIPVPPAVEPDLGYYTLQGMYTHPAYNPWELCLIPSSVPDMKVEQGGPARFIARPDGMWEHLWLFISFSGNVSNFSAGCVWPETNAISVSRRIGEYVMAEWADGGIGFTGNFWGADNDVAPRTTEGGSPGVEVFFAKI